MENLSINDFMKFLKRIKSLDKDKVFTDPFKKKPSKKAKRNVLTPQNKDGEDIPSTNNPINPRQAIVVQNKDFEVDADGKLIKEINKHIERMVKESILKMLEEERNRRLEEIVGKSLHQIINEYTRKTVRT